MAACGACGRRKGKRVCAALEGRALCSECCGERRSAACGPCVFNAGPVGRPGSAVEPYPASAMSWDPVLKARCLALEAAVIAADHALGGVVRDGDVVAVYEGLLARLVSAAAPVHADERRRRVSATVDEYLARCAPDAPPAEMARIVKTALRSARRGACGGRSYLDLVGTFVPPTLSLDELAAEAPCARAGLEGRHVEARRGGALPTTCPDCKLGLVRRGVGLVVEWGPGQTGQMSADVWLCPGCPRALLDGGQALELAALDESDTGRFRLLGFFDDEADDPLLPFASLTWTE